MSSVLTSSGRFVAVYSSTIPTGRPKHLQPELSDESDGEYDSIYLSVRQPPEAGVNRGTVYSDISSADDSDERKPLSDTNHHEDNQRQKKESNEDDEGNDDDDEDDEEDEDDEDDEDADYDDTDSSWTEGLSSSYCTNTATAEGMMSEDDDAGDIFSAKSVVYRKEPLRAALGLLTPNPSAAAAGGGGHGNSGQSESEPSMDEGPGYGPREIVDTNEGAGEEGKKNANNKKKTDYVMMSSSYMPVDGTTNEASPEDLPPIEALENDEALRQSGGAVDNNEADEFLEPDAEDTARMSLLEMMDDREIKRRLFFVLSQLPLRQRSDVLRQLITCSAAEQWHDWPDDERQSSVDMSTSILPAKPRRLPPVLQRSSSFIHRTRHLTDHHKTDAGGHHYYVSHHGDSDKVTTHHHNVDNNLLSLSLVAKDDALREKDEQEALQRKRREEVEVQVLEAFNAATEGKPKQDPASERRLKRDLRKLLVRRRSSGLKKKHLTFDRKWNEEYQGLLDKGIWNMSAGDAQEISNLMHDFVFNVETYAKVIINELNVDDSKKTIKPVEVGGIAGGEKYVVQGILFKFCKDPKLSKKPPIWLYGGDKPRDDFAMKAAGLELQGLSLLANPSLIASLRHPLMSLIDYKGFRMVAMCLLPLDVTSLRYGSDDGGKTVVASDPVLNKVMERVGRMYNLKKHTVGKERVPIIGPGDIEGHLGTDGRYYLLDYARLMPPEAPPSSQSGAYADRAVFYKMLRPEMVKQFHVPLSSDAFTGWSKYDTNIVESERDIREATKKMFEEVIPALARDLDETDISDFFERVLKDDAETDVDFLLIKVTKQTNTVYEMHRRGINMRHVGRLRELVKNKYWRSMLLSEAMSRCIKHQIRLKMRKAVLNSVGVSSESSCKDLVLEHVNIFFGASTQSDRFWKKKIKRLSAKKFPGLLTAQERKPTYDLRKSLSLRLVFLLTERWSILRLTDRIKRELLTKNIYHVRVLPGDVEEITASIHAIDASLYLMEAMDPDCDADEALRLLRSANEHLTAALDEKPRSSHMLWTLGRVEAEAARRKPFDQDAEQLFEKAITSHLQALEIEQVPGAYNSLASAMEAYADKLEETVNVAKERKRIAAEEKKNESEGEREEGGEPLWTDEEIGEKEDKVRTLRRQAVENRDTASTLEEEQPESSARVLQFCAEHLSG